MAEAVGIAAAAVQFVEIGTKILIAASKLRSKLENAPDKVRKSERSVKQLVSLVQKLQTELQPNSSTSLASFLSNDSKLEAKDILDDCISEASALLSILDTLMAKVDDTFVKGKMRALSYIKKEDELSERCKRLDELKSHLGIWYHHQSVSLLKEQLMAISVANVAIEAVGNRVDAGFAAIAQSLRQQHSTTAVGYSQQLTSVDIPVTLRTHRIGNSQPRKFPPNCACMRSQLAKSTCRVGPIIIIRRETGIHDQECHYNGKSQATDSEVHFKLALPRLLSRCVELSFLSTYAGGGVSLSASLRTINIVDPKLSPAFRRVEDAKQRVRDLLFHGCSLSLTGAFIFKSDWDDAHLSPLRKIFEELLMLLREDFRTGASSAKDVCMDGTSLVQELVHLLGVVVPYQSYLHEEAAPLLKLLLHFGVDLNTECSPSDAPIFYSLHDNIDERRDNPLNILQRYMGYEVCHGGIVPTPHFLRMLYQSGVAATEFPRVPKYSDLAAGLFPQIPDLALEMGMPRLSLAVVSRSAHGLKCLIQSGHDVNEMSFEGLTPLCLSIGWPEGIQVLLDAGADPNTAISEALKALDAFAVKEFIEAGCSLSMATLMEHGHWKSPLEVLLGHKRLWSTFPDRVLDILSIVTEAMADSRYRFMRLASTNLPTNILIRNGWSNPGMVLPLLDGNAQQISCLLDNTGVQVPSNLHPGFRKSVYHSLLLNKEVVESLYSRGFTEVDLPDKYGNTPFLICMVRVRRQADFRNTPILWLLDHGVSSVRFPALPGTSILHVLSDCFQKGCLRWRCPLQDKLSDLRIIVRRFSELSGTRSRDACKCWCSTGGCLPLNLLLKRLRPEIGIHKDRNPTRSTTWEMASDTLSHWMDWCGCDASDPIILEGICRLEIFQRLGMAHTCCRFELRHKVDVPYGVLSAFAASGPEREQLQEEDSCSKIQLDALVGIYTFLHEKYIVRSARLLQVWWEVLEDYLPGTVWIKQGYRYVELENPWCNLDLPDPQHLWTKTDEIKNRVIAAMNESTSTNSTS